MSAFDPVSFLGSTYDQGFDTRVPLHKPGDWKGYIGSGEKDIVPREVQITKGERAGEQVVIVDIWYYTEDPSAVGDGGIPPARARQSAWLDFVPGTKNLDFSPSKNRTLGYILTALGYQDKNGKLLKPWSWMGLRGARIGYRVEHRQREDTGDMVADVVAVVAP